MPTTLRSTASLRTALVGLGAVAALALVGYGSFRVVRHYRASGSDKHVRHAALRSEEEWSEVPRSCAEFEDSIGIVTEFNQNGIPDYFNDLLRPALRDLHMHHIKISMPLQKDFEAYYAHIKTLAADGVHPIVTLKLRKRSGGKFGNGRDTDPNDAVEFGRAIGAELDGIEMPNEYLVYNDDPGAAAYLHDYCSRVSAALKGDPTTKSIPLIGPSRAKPGIDMGDYSKIVDIGNIHIYDFPYETKRNVPRHKELDFERGFWRRKQRTYITETGLNTSTVEKSRVTEDGKAKMMPRQLVRFFMQRIDRTYIYQLVDRGFDKNDPEFNFGLIDAAGKRKPSFQALQRFMDVVGEQRRGNTDGKPFVCRVSGDLRDLHHLFLHKANGDILVLFWLDLDSNQSVAPQNIQFQFADPYSKITEYDPTNGSEPVHQWRNQDIVPVSATDGIKILRLESGR